MHDDRGLLGNGVAKGPGERRLLRAAPERSPGTGCGGAAAPMLRERQRGAEPFAARGSSAPETSSEQPGHGISRAEGNPVLGALAKAGELWPVTVPGKRGISGTDQSSGESWLPSYENLS